MNTTTLSKSLVLPLGFAFALGFCDAPARAATTIFANSPAAGAFLETPSFPNTPTSASTQWRYTGGVSRWLGFGFTAPSGVSLSSVSMELWQHAVAAGSLNTDFTISIVAMGPVEPVTGKQGPAIPLNVLYQETSTIPTTYSNEDYITFTFDTPYLLTEDTTYGILLAFTEPSSGINFVGAPSSSYSTGDIGWGFYTTDGGASYAISNVFDFSLASVPEPTTATLAGAAFMGMALARRRRSRCLA